MSEAASSRGPLVDFDHLNFPHVLEREASAGEELSLAGELLSDELDAILADMFR